MTSVGKKTYRRALLGATTASAIFAAQAAQAQTGPDFSDESPDIVVNDTLNPNQTPPTGVLATGVNGVGQMIVLNQAAGTLGLCTGSLVNPRMVIFAAHCVNSRDASAYGARTGDAPNSGTFGNLAGFPISFGFEATNRCTGTATNPGNGCLSGTGPYERWRDNGFTTQTGSHIYNVNQVWYDTRSLEPDAIGFLYADIAVATLDTPATDIPTWALLFSPLEGQTHATITGYGVNGTSASAQGGALCTTSCSPLGSIDYRRRAAENMISVLGSLDETDLFLFGSTEGTNPQALYLLDFDSPDGELSYNPSQRRWDFDIFNGTALPGEGTTAGGDSGGPLVVDQEFDIPVIAGVLSGGSRYFNGQRFSTYGTTSFYQPLFLYWEEVVANNPYVYTAAKAGDAFWDNPAHWVQLMDPAYQILVDGDLVNGLPNFFSDGPDGNGPRFGEVCFLDDCANITDIAAFLGTGNPLETSPVPIIVENGPGSTNFVPNNIEPINSLTPGATVKARYFDVTLNAIGTTTLRTNVTIDRFAIDSPFATLNVRKNSSLTSLTDYTQYSGWTNVDGRINARETLIVSGILSGVGTFDPTYLTVVGGRIMPAQAGPTGTLTVQGDVILASGSRLVIDVLRTSNDVLRVTGDSANTGILSLGGTVQFSTGLGIGPRDGQTFTFATAAGGIDGTFSTVVSNLGVLTPVLTYGPNSVSAKLQAGSLATQVQTGGGGGTFADVLAGLLDLLRTNSYNNLYGLYGAIDVMDPQRLTATLQGMAPRIADESQMLGARQSRMMLNSVTDRLSMLGAMPGGTLSVATDTGVISAMSGNPAPSTLGFNSIVPSRAGLRTLPEGVTGFISSSYSVAGTTLGSDRIGSFGGQQAWQVGMGLELAVAPQLTFGTAFGYSDGFSRPDAGSHAETRTSQMAVYGNYRLGGGAYIAGVASADISRFNLARNVSAGPAAMSLNGATSASRMGVRAEAGVNMAMGGLTLTPRVAVAYSSYRLDGFREQGGEAALQFDELSVQQLESRIGAQLTGSRRLSGGWTFVPQLQADVVRLLSGTDDGMTVRFALAPEQGIALPLAGGDAMWGEVRGGVRLANGPVEFGAALETSVGRAFYRDDRAVADFTFRF